MSETVGKGRATARRTLFKIMPGIFLSGALLWWLLKSADLEEVAREMRNVPIWAVVAPLVPIYLSIPLRGLQWRWLLGAPREATNVAATKSICLGHTGNLLLPLRGGELVRILHLSGATGISVPRMLPSVVLARLQDLLPIFALLIAAVGLVFLGSADSSSAGETDGRGASLLSFAGWAAGATLVAGVALFLVYRYRHQALQLAYRLFPKASARVNRRIQGTLADMETGLDVLGDKKYFWGSQAVAFVCWILFVLAPVPLLMAFSFTLTQALTIAVVQTAVTTFAHFLPSAPGAIGTFHTLCIFALSVVAPDLDQDLALTYTIVVHLVGTAGPAIPGLLMLPFEFRTIARLLQKSRETRELGPDE